VGADDPGAGLGGDAGEVRVHPAPGVVDDVGAGGQRLPRHLGPPGVDRDRQRRVGGADRRDQVDGPADLLAASTSSPGAAFTPPTSTMSAPSATTRSTRSRAAAMA
jgi:hypothetical protein